MDKPTSINFSEFENELKINTNVTLNVSNISNRYMIANFSLQYVEAVSYSARWSAFTVPEFYTRPEGWHLAIRWLTAVTKMETAICESCSTDVFGNFDMIVNRTSSHISYQNVTYSSTKFNFDLTAANYIKLNDCQYGYVKKIIIEFSGILTVGHIYTVNLTINDITTEHIYTVGSDASSIEFYLNQFIDDGGITLSIESSDEVNASLDIFKIITGDEYIRDSPYFNSEDYTNFILLAKNFDGQRGVAFATDSEATGFSTEISYNLFAPMRIVMTKETVDARLHSLDDLEFYMEDPRSGIFYLVEGEFAAVSADNMSAENYFWFEFNPTAISNTTLNFNYGLGASVVPYKMAEVTYPAGIYYTIGDYIRNEIFYNNRSYYVKEDRNIYHSHISGNGKLQSDSFPYDEEVQFGFIYENNTDEAYKALAITPMNELIVISSTRMYVYYMEGMYKKLRVVNGSYGISSLQSLVVSKTGKPVAEVLLWVDNNGAYIYGGGVNPPKNIILRTHENFWRLLDDTTIKCFYEKGRKEFWIVYGEYAILYMLTTGSWRKISFGKTVKQIIPAGSDIYYLLFIDNTMSYIDNEYDDLADGTVTTHYSTEYTIDDRGNIIGLSEDTDKIMQEILMTFKTTADSTGARIGLMYEVIIDDDIAITPKIYFSGLTSMYKVLSPILIRFRKAKIKLYITGSSKLEIRSFGYTHNSKAQGSIIKSDEYDNSGFGHDFGTDFGNQL